MTPEQLAFEKYLVIQPHPLPGESHEPLAESSVFSSGPSCLCPLCPEGPSSQDGTQLAQFRARARRVLGKQCQWGYRPHLSTASILHIPSIFGLIFSRFLKQPPTPGSQGRPASPPFSIQEACPSLRELQPSALPLCVLPVTWEGLVPVSEMLDCRKEGNSCFLSTEVP